MAEHASGSLDPAAHSSALAPAAVGTAVVEHVQWSVVPHVAEHVS